MRQPLSTFETSPPGQGRRPFSSRKSLSGAGRKLSTPSIHPSARNHTPTRPCRFPHRASPGPRSFLLVRFSNAGRHRPCGKCHAAARIEKPPTKRTFAGVLRNRVNGPLRTLASLIVRCDACRQSGLSLQTRSSSISDLLQNGQSRPFESDNGQFGHFCSLSIQTKARSGLDRLARIS